MSVLIHMVAPFVGGHSGLLAKAVGGGMMQLACDRQEAKKSPVEVRDEFSIIKTFPAPKVLVKYAERFWNCSDGSAPRETVSPPPCI